MIPHRRSKSVAGCAGKKLCAQIAKFNSLARQANPNAHQVTGPAFCSRSHRGSQGSDHTDNAYSAEFFFSSLLRPSAPTTRREPLHFQRFSRDYRSRCSAVSFSAPSSPDGSRRIRRGSCAKRRSRDGPKFGRSRRSPSRKCAGPPARVTRCLSRRSPTLACGQGRVGSSVVRRARKDTARAAIRVAWR
jgi:hypothetical protein